MQNHLNFFAGIDVSKLWFDASLMIITDHQKQPMISHRFDNTAPGLKTFDKWLRKHQVSFNEHSLVVIENTGVYHRLLWQYCSTHQLPLHIGNATHIKWSFGIARGKNDLVDSQRLCSYACKHGDELKVTSALDNELLKLKDLMSARSRLVAQRSSIQVYLAELQLSAHAHTGKFMEQAHRAALQGIEQSIKEIEKHIMQSVDQQPAVKTNYELLITVPGIGLEPGLHGSTDYRIF